MAQRERHHLVSFVEQVGTKWNGEKSGFIYFHMQNCGGVEPQFQQTHFPPQILNNVCSFVVKYNRNSVFCYIPRRPVLLAMDLYI